MVVNNALCKKDVAGIKMRLHRKLCAKGRDSKGEEKVLECDSVVMKTFWKFKIAAGCPDACPHDSLIRMSTNNKEVNCEEGRFLLLTDIETGADLPIE